MSKESRRHLVLAFISALVVVFFVVSFSSAAKATRWDVYSWMTRPVIQGVVDAALNGDTIYFHAGTYDWSGDWTPETLPRRWENTGAIVIADKTLTLRGEAGTLLIGPQSIGTGPEAQGVNAFKIHDLDMNNDVTFDRLNFQTFLRGINAGYFSVPDYELGLEILEPNLRNLTVKNCTFVDIRRQSVATSNIGGNVLVQNCVLSGGTIALFSDWYWTRDHLGWQPKDTFIRILDNKITSLDTSVYLNKTTNVIITNNSISSPSGIAMISANNGANIIGNSLSDCRYAISIWGLSNGAVIEQNEFTNISSFGIGLWNTDCHGNFVSKNRINLAGPWGAGIESNANNNYYGQNTISGMGWSAIWLTGDSEGSSYKETFQANNVDNFTPAYCHFYLGPTTHDNLIIGSGMDHNTYIDLGFNNRITGVTPLPGGIGQDLSDAIHLRNKELREAKPAIY